LVDTSLAICKTFVALAQNGFLCASVPLRNYSLTLFLLSDELLVHGQCCKVSPIKEKLVV